MKRQARLLNLLADYHTACALAAGGPAMEAFITQFVESLAPHQTAILRRYQEIAARRKRDIAAVFAALDAETTSPTDPAHEQL